MKQKLAIVAFVIASTACGGALTEPKTSLKEANCQLTVLLGVLGNKDAVIDEVLSGSMTLKEAVLNIGGLEEDAVIAQAQLDACKALTAPPPAPGDKVM